jgi:hypothetical protein
MHARHSTASDPETGVSLGASTNRLSCYQCHPGSIQDACVMRWARSRREWSGIHLLSKLPRRNELRGSAWSHRLVTGTQLPKLPHGHGDPAHRPCHPLHPQPFVIPGLRPSAAAGGHALCDQSGYSCGWCLSLSILVGTRGTAVRRLPWLATRNLSHQRNKDTCSPSPYRATWAQLAIARPATCRRRRTRIR